MTRRSEILVALCIAAVLTAGLEPARAAGEQARSKQAARKTGGAAAREETLQFDASIEMPKVVKQVAPKYPEEARKRGEQGMVLVRVLVRKDCTVGPALIPPGKGATPALDRAALECIRQWTFEPAKKKGKPVAVYVMIPVNFKLDSK